MAKKNLGKEFVVVSGQEYAGEVGLCSEETKHSKLGIMLKLDLSCGSIWFNISELLEN